MGARRSTRFFVFLVLLAAVACGRAERPDDLRTFVRFAYEDPRAGLEAFRLLLPKGWVGEGGIAWSADPALPARSDFRFRDPAGTAELRVFPTQACFWTDNRLFLATNPPGTLRFGTLVAEPIDLPAAFRTVLLPKFRPEASGLRIVGESAVPELAELARGVATEGVSSAAEGGKIRIEYEEAGRQMEEEMYAAVSQFVVPLPGSALGPGYFIDYWYIDYVFSFRAEKGELDSHAGTFQTMIHSFEVNPSFFAKVANVREALAREAIEGIHAAGRIGEKIARAGRDLRADQQSAWEQRQLVQDEIARNFSDYVRGVDRFDDPFSGQEVELPAGYGHAWANNLGEYIVTESPSFNPNEGSNLTWVLLPSSK